MRKGSKLNNKIFLAGMICMLCIQQLTAQHSGNNYPNGTLVNFVRTWNATAPEQDPNTLMARQLRDVKEATQYFDGLGRPLQTVIRKGSMVTGDFPSDLVSPVEYDEFGREQYKYLPYKATVDNGSFKLTPFTDQTTFFNSSNSYSPITGQGETFFYSKINFEPSPLNRIMDTYAPGNSWAGSEINAASLKRNVQVKYAFNTAIDAVHVWTVTDNATLGQFGTYATTTSSTYAAGELYKAITTDEHKKQVIEFKDKMGKVILEKVQLTGAADDGTGIDYTGWLSTYYIYDDLGNLRCVIQPEAVKTISNPVNPTWSLTTSLLNEQCFRYEYDQRNRMIKKKIPGSAAVCMVYDARDRMVLSQDGNLAVQGKWIYTQYDDLNRPVATGLWPSALTWSQHASAAAGSIVYPTLSGEEELTRTFYNDYNWLAGYGNPLPSNYNSGYDSYFQTVSNSNWPYAQANKQSANIKGMPTGGRVKVLGTTNTYLYTVSFYDDKGRVIQTQNTNITGGIGIVTNQYTWAGQLIVSIQKQEKAGTSAQTTIVVSQMNYDDLGRLVKTEKKVSNTLVKVNGVLNDMPSYKTTAQYEYNALGELKTKKIAPQYNSNLGLETLTYDYNIRGWMLGMNRGYAKDDPSYSSRYFGFDLGYDKANNNIIGSQTYNTPQYNGNIEGMVWKSKGDGEKRKYDFGYDAANRLLKADFTQYSSSSFNQSAGVNFNIIMGNGTTFLPDGSLDPTTAYDDNGNIKQMKQYGLKINASEQIDNLRYTYIAGTNRLKSVVDFNNDATTVLGDFKTNTSHLQSAYKAGLNTSSTPSQFDVVVDYDYDINGNLKLDNNKAISSIIYNHLNLPQTITVGPPPSGPYSLAKSITYTYDALGSKLQKQAYESSGPGVNRTVTTTYLNGFVYETKVTNAGGTYDPTENYTDVLQFIPQEEGRIRFKPAAGSIDASLQYDYMLKDHLGNVRMVLTEEQQQDKYPIASLEDTKLTTEQTYYDINTNFIRKTDINPLGGLPTYINNYNGIGNNPADAAFEGTNSKNLYRINGNENKTGLGITLKVMAGDKVNIFGNSYYSSAVVNNGSCSGCALSVTNLVTAFLNAPSAVTSTAGHGAVGPSLVESQAGSGITGGLLSNQNSQALANSNRPRAFINYILFDEQFKYAGGGTSIVGAAGAFTKHQNDPQLQDIPVPKNGYIYVYCSNESNTDVFFDNLQVVHTRGAILEETHYYPFGLTMAGISSKAAGGIENKRKWNGGTELASKEFIDGDGLELYETNYRSLDPQLGRFIQTDPLSAKTQSMSPYNFGYNNPVAFNDPFGLDPGYVENTETGEVTFMKDVHDQSDLDPDSKLKYLGERMKSTSQDGTSTWWDENGKSTQVNPHWENLNEVIVHSGTPLKGGGFNGQYFGDIKPESGSNTNASWNLIKYKESQESLKKAQETFATITTSLEWATALAGGLPTDVRSADEYVKIIKNYRNIRKLANPISITLGYYAYKTNSMAEQLDGILAKYTAMHMATASNPHPAIANGMLVITQSWTVWGGVPGASGNGAIYYYYDAATHELIGNVNY